MEHEERLRTAHELERWVRDEMRMSHVYQPAVLRAVLDAGGVATVPQIAQALLAADEAQLRWYEDRAKKMPLAVLQRHGVVHVEDNLVRLATPQLSFEERARLRAACEERIGRFLQARGLSTWDARLIETDPVPESLRYQVLVRDRKCVLCGAGPEDAPLQVDHIKPRSKGGTNDVSNLQTLCDRCNRGKSNRDDTRLLHDPARSQPGPPNAGVSKQTNLFRSLREFDLATGVRLVGGADEAGRACLAGPLVAAACLFDWESLTEVELDRLCWLRDSKKVSPTRRSELRTVIQDLAMSVAVTVISPAEIDRDGLEVSNVRALREAVARLEPAPGVCFADWYAVPDCRYPVTALEDGDNTSAAVAAASIIAKTTRDELMAEVAREYPDYGFNGHKGYINDVHNDAIRRLGITPHHRKSFDAAIYRELGLRR